MKMHKRICPLEHRQPRKPDLSILTCIYLAGVFGGYVLAKITGLLR